MCITTADKGVSLDICCWSERDGKIISIRGHVPPYGSCNSAYASGRQTRDLSSEEGRKQKKPVADVATGFSMGKCSGICLNFGGGCEIRTHGRITPSAVFKTAGLNHSPKPPDGRILHKDCAPFGIVRIFALSMKAIAYGACCISTGTHFASWRLP